MRKVAVVVASRANYGRVKSVLRAIEKHPKLELQLIVSGSMVLYRYGQAMNVVQADGFEAAKKIYYIVEGENLVTQAKSTGLGIIELSTAFEELKPDIVITVADRFETMATAIAASYLNIPLAHIQGGEITGNIDETVRHAITKLSHYHFPATEESKERLIKMGEEKWRVVNSGCPAMDTLAIQDLSLKGVDDFIANKQEFERFDLTKPYVLMIQHPVTTEVKDGYDQISKTLNALKDIDIQKIVLWPNIDAGRDEVTKGIVAFSEKYRALPFFYYKNFPPEIYNKILANAKCAVGNSSSFIREGSFLGVPAVIVGNRQEGREHGRNIMQATYDTQDIKNAVQKQLAHGKYEKETIFGNGHAGEIIADYLAEVKLDINKRMTY